MRVALCDDHLVMAEALAAVLTSRGYDVVAVTADPAAIVTVAEEHRPQVCVLDVHFPNGDGMQACAAIKAVSPSTQVLFLSATAGPAEVQAAIAAGAAGYLRKDAGLERIIRAVDDVAAGMVVVEPSLLRAAIAAGRRQHEGAIAARFLTPRELQVLQLLVDGGTTAGIAADLHVSTTTARTHIQNLLSKLGVHSRLEAAAFAVRHGIVTPKRLPGLAADDAPNA